MNEIIEHLPEINLNVNHLGTKVARYMESRGCFYEYKIQTTTAGYKQIQAVVNGKRKTFMVHRLVAMAFVDGRGVKCEVNHIDGDKSNNHMSNLEWCTHQENMKHARFTLKNGGGRPCRLDFAQILTIHTLKGMMKQIDIAKFYSCTQTTVSEVILGKNYSGIHQCLNQENGI